MRRRHLRGERRPRQGHGAAGHGIGIRPQRLRLRHRGKCGPRSSALRGLDFAVTATGCRASRRGAPGPQGALRPLGLRSDAGIRRFCLALAARGRNAPSGSPSGRAPLTPPTARERLHSVAPRGLHHSAVSRAVGSRCGLPNAPSGSPPEALRSRIPKTLQER